MTISIAEAAIEGDNGTDDMNEEKGLTLTSLLAAYGAILASFTFGWTLYRDLRDRRMVKFQVEIRKLGIREDGAMFSIAPSSGIEGASEGYFLVFSMVNVGRRPVRIKGIGGNYKKKVNGKSGFIFSARFLPKTLDEQEALDEFSEFTTVENIMSISVWDVSGKTWKVSRWQLLKLKKDAERILAERKTS
jgi:hypothetical protein